MVRIFFAQQNLLNSFVVHEAKVTCCSWDSPKPQGSKGAPVERTLELERVSFRLANDSVSGMTAYKVEPSRVESGARLPAFLVDTSRVDAGVIATTHG